MVKISRRRFFYALVGLAMLTAIITPTLMLVNNDSPIDAATLVQEAQEQKEALLRGIAEGQILYITIENFQKDRLPMMFSLQYDAIGHSYPDRLISEMWFLVDEEGNVATIVEIASDLAGNPLAYASIEGGRHIIRDIASGEEMVISENVAPWSLSGWVEGFWDIHSSLAAEELESAGNGELNGEPSAVFENWSSDGLSRIEFDKAHPLKWKQTRYDLDDGELTVSDEHGVLDYYLLPAGSPVGLDAVGD